MDNPDIIDLAARLDGRDPSQILAPDEELDARGKGLAVMFATGELNVFIRGRLHWDGEVHSGFDYHVFEETPEELAQPAEWQETSAGQAHQRRVLRAPIVEGRRGAAAKPHLWRFDTTLPHARFDVVRGGEMLCEGLVFQVPTREDVDGQAQ